jgi:hypothetical protein
MKRIVSALAAATLAAATLAACETAPLGPPVPPPYLPPPPPGAEFREQDFAWSTQPGAGRIDGVLAYGGGGFTCTNVILAPETPWSRARMRTLYLSTTAAAEPADEVRARTPPEHAREYAAYAKVAHCDATGRFAFANLPDGGWYAITVANPVGGGGARIAVMRHVVTAGGPVRVVLR